MRAIKYSVIRYTAILAVCGLGLLAVSASSASAASWKVSKVALVGEAALAEKAKVLTPIEIGLPAFSTTVTCKAVVVQKHAKAPIELNGTFTFQECSGGSEGCAVPSSIKTNQLTSVAKTVGLKGGELPTKPTTGETVLTLELSGPKCPLGKVPVKGSFTATSPELQVELVEHELAFSSSSLKGVIGEKESTEVTLKGSIFVALASEKTWSFS